MTRPSRHDKAKTRKDKVRVRTSMNLPEEADVALGLYAGRMKKYRGRRRSVTLATEHILYLNQDFLALLPEARTIIGDRNNVKQEQQDERQGGTE